MKKVLPEIFLICGLVLSVGVGILIANISLPNFLGEHPKNINPETQYVIQIFFDNILKLLGILIALMTAILSFQLSIFSEQKGRLAFELFYYRNNSFFSAIFKLVNVYKKTSRRKKEWPILHKYIDSYISGIEHFAEIADSGRLEKLPEEERQIYLRGILEEAKRNQTFRATSYVSINTWWRSEIGKQYYLANVTAAKRGVTIKRIFIVPNLLLNDIKHDVIKHSTDNIDVRICLQNELPAHYLHNYAILENEVVTHSTITPAAESSQGTISYAKGDIDSYVTNFETLWEHYAKKPNILWQDVLIDPTNCRRYQMQSDATIKEGNISVLNHDVKNLLYDNPMLYDIVYQSRPAMIKKMCSEAFSTFMTKCPTSILDLGCGTGSCLNAFTVNENLYLKGIDGHCKLINYAREMYPTLSFECKDIRNLKLEKHYECVLMLGWVLNYAISNRDVELYISSIASHITMGGLLVLEVLNGFSFFPDGSKRGNVEVLEIRDPKNPAWKANASVKYNFDPLSQIVIRNRTWEIYEEGRGKKETDICPFRLLFPLEINFMLEKYGFKVLQVRDDFSLEPGRANGESLMIIARYETNALCPI